ncbi:MAG: ADP-ribosylglycohydrolase family protein [Phycisphaeraceae bacterium]
MDGLQEELARIATTGSYDAIVAFAYRLRDLPLRDDWQYIEPSDLEGILEQCDPGRAVEPLAEVHPHHIAPRIETAFLSSICGCILGKPIEGWLDLHQIRAAATELGEWPLSGYIPEAMLKLLDYRHPDWHITVRERIGYVAPDDDINYSVLGMMLLEKHGLAVAKHDIADMWIKNLPVFWCWGPERTQNINASLWAVNHGPEFPFRDVDVPFNDWVELLNAKDEYCGALIRADAYGYACAGHPALAAELAWRDASFTHRRTGIYSSMFIAAAIAAAFVVDEPMTIFQTALRYVPQRSRFADTVRNCLDMVASASDWIEGYERVHATYEELGNCRIHQEIGTLINTLRFAGDIGEGLGMQVAQGNDTDSFGCTAGSVLGAFHGPDALDPRWLTPFNDTIHTTLATFQEQRLSAVATRMGQLPARLAAHQPA